MKKLVAGVLLVSIFNLMVGCSSRSVINPDTPPIGESVTIRLIDGTTREGVILKKEGEILKYIDTQSHVPEDLEINKIRSINYAGKVYDLEGNVISESQISEAKGISKTLVYSFGGFILGAAAGFGIAAIVNSMDADIAPVYPMLGIGIISGIYFGSQGSRSDREDSIDDIRSERYEVSQAQLKKQLEEEKRKLLEQKKQHEKIKKDLKKKEN
jgi:hypothetical protein